MIKVPFLIKTIILSIFKWQLKTGFTVIATVSSKGSGKSAHAHTCLSHPYLHIQSIDVDEG